MTHPLTRRHLIGLATAVLLLPRSAVAQDGPVIEIDWEDLIPGEDSAARQAYETLGVIQHDQITTPAEDFSQTQISTEYDGKRVRIPGFAIPLEYSGSGVTSFLLVPYVGACIHVPPPPPNQLIFVTTEKPADFDGLFEPIYVTGVLGAAATATELADVGYAIAADRVEPYTG